MSEPFSLRFTLLDQELVDRDGTRIGRIDDLELAIPAGGGPPEIVGLYVGAQALGRRIGGWTGRAMEAIAERLREPGGEPGPVCVDAALVSEVQPMVKLDAALADLPVAGLERWLARHFVARLPGAGDAR